MCGIAGIVGERRAPEALRGIMCGMLGMIRHRGPDQFGIYQDEAATLGSARLSIIDLAGGQQPIANEDETLWIVFNGEVFNYVELRPALEARGHRFASETDTEVLLHLYEEHGAACLDRVNGQFAAAIWDARKRRLFLARDRLGIRPLFYTRAGPALLFASEVKALLAHPDVSARIDPAVVDQVFTYWGPLPGRSVFEGIHELPAGHFLTLEGGSVHMSRYWQMRFSAGGTGSAAEKTYLAEFEDLLVDATLIRLRSDVPVGAYLSGGLDSSVLAHIVASKKTAPCTFSIAFDDAAFDESEFQAGMARFLGTRHEIVRASYADIARVFPRVIWHTETPVTRTAPAPLFLLSQLVRDRGFKVVVSGEGADEVLAGYDIFKEAAIRRFWARQPASRVRPLLFRRLYADIPGLNETGPAFLTAFFGGALEETGSPWYSHLVRWRNNARARRFFSEDAAAALGGARPPDLELPSDFMKWGALERAQYLESAIFLSQYLLSSQGDRVAMAHSVESRMPFLDYRVVEFCNRLPAAVKLRALRDKLLLRRLGRQWLPASVWQRPKRPYRAPIHRSFFCPGAPEYVRELLSATRIRRAGLFKPAAVEQLVKKAATGMPLGETDDMALAGILSAQLVHRLFVTDFEAAPPVTPGRDDVKVHLAPAVTAAA